MREGRLIAASCTTGWFDWIHGELWLLPDGLLRLRTSFSETRQHGLQPTVQGDLPTRGFNDGEVERLARLHKTNLWAPANQIKTASLRSGLTTPRLNLKLVDGSNVKLLWLKGEPAQEELRRALQSWRVSLSRLP